MRMIPQSFVTYYLNIHNFHKNDPEMSNERLNPFCPIAEIPTNLSEKNKNFENPHFPNKSLELQWGTTHDHPNHQYGC